MTLRVPKILPQVRLGVVARDPTLTEKLLELPAVHVSQGARLTERERAAAVERKGQLFEELGLNLGGWKPHGIHNLGRYFQDELRHRRSPSGPIVAGSQKSTYPFAVRTLHPACVTWTLMVCQEPSFFRLPG